MNGWNGLSGRFIKFLDGLHRLDEMGRTVVKLEKNEIKSSSKLTQLTPNPSILPQTRLTLLNQPKPPNPPPDTPPWVASSVI